MSNVYFLVEGRRTEMKLYPAWLEELRPDLSRVKNPDDIQTNNYYIFSGNGFPSLLHNHLKNAIQDVNRVGRYTSFVIILDSDEETADKRTEEVLEFYGNSTTGLTDGIRFVVVVQNPCIETWLLGNKKMFKRNPQSEDYRGFIGFYNVQENDPESMEAMPPFEFVAQFHEAYLVAMFEERNQRYSKRNPGIAASEDYLNQLSKRAKQGDLTSFQGMLEIMRSL